MQRKLSPLLPVDKPIFTSLSTKARTLNFLFFLFSLSYSAGFQITHTSSDFLSKTRNDFTFTFHSLFRVNVPEIRSHLLIPWHERVGHMPRVLFSELLLSLSPLEDLTDNDVLGYVEITVTCSQCPSIFITLNWTTFREGGEQESYYNTISEWSLLLSLYIL